jgi:crotonobetainyl-CoA:carnitine CoA-transferase CaiB-like acyl-CoA transferase
MMLADLGADVIKVEAIEGDSFRELPGFYGWNRGSAPRGQPEDPTARKRTRWPARRRGHG